MICPDCDSNIPDPPVLLYHHLINAHGNSPFRAKMLYLIGLAELLHR